MYCTAKDRYNVKVGFYDNSHKKYINLVHSNCWFLQLNKTKTENKENELG